MSNETIRKNLVDALNELTRLIEVTEDPNERFELKIIRMQLFQRLDRVIVATLDSSTTEFSESIAALKELTEQAKNAKTDLNKVTQTISKATDAIGKVEKLLKNVVGVLSIV